MSLLSPKPLGAELELAMTLPDFAYVPSVHHMLQLPLLCKETCPPVLAEPVLHVGCAHEQEHI